MHKSIQRLFAAAIVLALAAPVFGGGFVVVLGNPDANTQAKAINAVLTVKAAGCHEPEKATVTGTAIGSVNGQRQTIPLKMVRLSEAGSYAITQQWPSEGRWVLQFVATDKDRITSTIVAAGASGVERNGVKYSLGRQPAEDEIAAMLAGTKDVARK